MRRDHDAEAARPDDEWASSWKRTGKSIGRSPRTTTSSLLLLPVGEVAGCSIRESPRREQAGAKGQLVDALVVKSYDTPATFGDVNVQLAAPADSSNPRNIFSTSKPYARKRAASVVNLPLLERELS
jgi:hypothetical protein